MTNTTDPSHAAGALRRRLCTALALAPLLPARAAETAARRSYAVLSLIGDEFRIVTRRAVTGTTLDPNEQTATRVDNAVLDDVAFVAADTAIADARPEADRLRASIRDARLFAAQEGLLRAGGGVDGLRDALRGVLSNAGATHLVLITKRRDDARFTVSNGVAGAGRVAGVGFYIDNNETLTLADTGDRSRGYVAAFASVNVDVVELATLMPHAPQGAFEAFLAPTAISKDAVLAWDALTPAVKIELLQRVIGRAVDKATRAALA